MRDIITIIIATLLLPIFLAGCSENVTTPGYAVTDARQLETDSVSAFDSPLESMPEPTVAVWYRPIGGSYGKVFNDSNYIHWAEAEKIGIEPITDTRSHWDTRRPIVKIASCQDYYVEPLTHSSPYMIPEGAEMLHEIGRRFRDTLQSRGGGAYRIKVTSVLRTPESVSELRRNNRNAIDSSVHKFGTTVDVSYSHFAADNDTMPRSCIDLKGILAEVLLAMRSEGKCWVKHERKQPCFHITVRDRKSWASK